jgi:hypothetical protein
LRPDEVLARFSTKPARIAGRSMSGCSILDPSGMTP